MINDELLDKFDKIQDLPVSEEMLGAYLEGKLSNEENEFVHDAIESDLTLMNITFSASQPIHDVFFEDVVIDSIELPLINNEINFDESGIHDDPIDKPFDEPEIPSFPDLDDIPDVDESNTDEECETF